MRNFQGLQVEGVVDSPSPMNAAIARMATILQMTCIALIVFGDKFCAALNRPTPLWYHDIQRSKMMYLGIVWLVGNFFVAQLTTTGAFEVAMGDELLWSKKDTGQLPESIDYLISQVSTRLYQ
ncbi:hypothetical protein SARC_13190 [Sphaeroforma arctica JP610]|uniref:Selenoprotein T n=1 Tax=Sphaeroforma arctica JP610 TaxID=667725 RepID=A0A0L0FDW6_9EUKA|nr:hypothetical protein SARC_13190 [Sphaeroforma arctica JP610]KNC74258.1 hypothetical protein SARC_13190 [Sphaeroforma arctica JP610]|eukprot:XP_014148160.1 hypothetical protein SARC_13190 [Sphaeroforma arctica JP610]